MSMHYALQNTSRMKNLHSSILHIPLILNLKRRNNAGSQYSQCNHTYIILIILKVMNQKTKMTEYLKVLQMI